MASQGPLLAGTGADDSAVGTATWTNPGNITANDGVRAVALLNASTSHYLRASSFGFSIPTGATIDGIVVEVEKSQSAASSIRDSRVRIVKADATVGTTDKADTATDWVVTTDTVKSYGSSSDLWGETWTPADVNDADFGVVISAVNAAASATNARVDFIRITVYYTAGGAPVNVPLDTSAASSAATLAARATTAVPLGASPGVSISALSLHAESVIVLGVVSATSTATLEFQVPAGVALQTGIATASAVLAISALTDIPLNASAGVASAMATLGIFSPFNYDGGSGSTYGGTALWTYDNEDVYTPA